MSYDVWIRAGSPKILNCPFHSGAVRGGIRWCDDPGLEAAVDVCASEQNINRCPAKLGKCWGDARKEAERCGKTIGVRW